MTLQEVRKARDELERALLDGIRGFEAATGLEVEDVTFRRVQASATHAGTECVNVNLHVRLP